MGRSHVFSYWIFIMLENLVNNTRRKDYKVINEAKELLAIPETI